MKMPLDLTVSASVPFCNNVTDSPRFSPDKYPLTTRVADRALAVVKARTSRLMARIRIELLLRIGTDDVFMIPPIKSFPYLVQLASC